MGKDVCGPPARLESLVECLIVVGHVFEVVADLGSFCVGMLKESTNSANVLVFVARYMRGRNVWPSRERHGDAANLRC